MCREMPTLREFAPDVRKPPQTLSRKERNKALRTLALVRSVERQRDHLLSAGAHDPGPGHRLKYGASETEVDNFMFGMRPAPPKLKDPSKRKRRGQKKAA